MNKKRLDIAFLIAFAGVATWMIYLSFSGAAIWMLYLTIILPPYAKVGVAAMSGLLVFCGTFMLRGLSSQFVAIGILFLVASLAHYPLTWSSVEVARVTHGVYFVLNWTFILWSFSILLRLAKRLGLAYSPDLLLARRKVAITAGVCFFILLMTISWGGSSTFGWFVFHRVASIILFFATVGLFIHARITLREIGQTILSPGDRHVSRRTRERKVPS